MDLNIINVISNVYKLCVVCVVFGRNVCTIDYKLLTANVTKKTP